MQDDDLNLMIDELLARELRPNTREDLGAFRKELAAGTLAKDDAKYIRALHARVVGGGAPPAAVEDDDDEEEAPGEIEDLRRALAEAQQKEEALAAECERLKAELADLRRELDAAKAARG